MTNPQFHHDAITEPINGYHEASARIQAQPGTIGAADGATPLQPWQANTPPIAPRPASAAAIISFVFGILGVFLTPVFMSAVVAVIFGHIARIEIQRGQGYIGGKRLALAGLILGYVGLFLGLVFALILLINYLRQFSAPTR